MIKFKRVSVILLVLGMFLQLTPTVFAQGPETKEDILKKIRNEAMNNSQIMKTLHHFTDVYGPRLTGSPKLEKAGKWAMKQMDEWGFDKTYMDPWDWGNVGWENDKASGFLISPVKDSLVFEVLAWTPSTKGTVKGEAVQITLTPQIQTQAGLNQFLNGIKDKIKGKIVLVNRPNPRAKGVNLNTPPKRRDTDALKKTLKPREIGPAPKTTPRPRPRQRFTFREALARIDKFMLDNGVLVRINDAGRRHGQIRAFSNRSFDSTTTVPTVVMRNEDYGRIWRLLDNGNKVELEFNIQNSIYPEGKTSYNTIGEITGTEKPDEVIMLGGHLDAWHSATGATDNGVGCAVMMEAARIIKAIGVKPKRTIRVALWSGEEQGLLGSRAYVAKHFGSFENPKPAYSKFGGYFNVDSGTGRVRGLSVFGPAEAAKMLGNATSSLSDLNFVGVSNTASRRLGGSDHTSFNQAGLPGIGTILDPIEYFTHTWHTNLDTYERIVEDDVKASAAIVATAVYYLAMRDDLLPRLSKEQMPASTINP